MSVMMNDVIGVVVENEVSKLSRLPIAKTVPVATALKNAGVKLSTWRVTINWAK